MASFNEEALGEIRAKISQHDLEARCEFLSRFEAVPLEVAQLRTPIVRVNCGGFEGYVAEHDHRCRVLSLIHESREQFPAFQWDGCTLVPAVSVVCTMFDSMFSPWQTAFWLGSTNSWLGGAAPVELLLTQPEQVLLAAHYAYLNVATPAP